MGDFAKKNSGTALLGCHREQIVNLIWLRVLTPRNSRDDDLNFDLPTNRRISIARDRFEDIRKMLGVWILKTRER
jgi:hypothetical protein